MKDNLEMKGMCSNLSQLINIKDHNNRGVSRGVSEAKRSNKIKKRVRGANINNMVIDRLSGECFWGEYNLCVKEGIHETNFFFFSDRKDN